MSSILFSIRSKGMGKYLRRGQAILNNYGLTPSKMMQALDLFSRTLGEFQCGATFPITAITVERNGKMVQEYMARGIEFAIHGYRHIDHSQLSPQEQLAHLRRARNVFDAAGIPVSGFRAPYLQFNQAVYAAAQAAGLAYSSNQPILWDVLAGESVSPAGQAAYRRAIAFYQPWSASQQPSLPCLKDQLVEIPVSLPDDEILLDRLQGEARGLAARVWSRILAESHRRQELFTLQLHPERIARCAPAVAQLLAEARALDPPVWIARLAEIAAWWRALSQATVAVTYSDSGEPRLSLQGPPGAAFLIRNLAVDAPACPWARGYQRSQASELVLKTRLRPWIGVPVSAPQELTSFLKQQGYIVQISDRTQDYSIYIDQTGPVPIDKRALLDRIETSDKPLVKLARWPNGAGSALTVTGDIDALTIWDFGLRYLGH